MSFIQEMQGADAAYKKSVSIIQHINSIKGKNHNHLDRYRKNWQNSTPFIWKINKKTRNRTFST